MPGVDHDLPRPLGGHPELLSAQLQAAGEGDALLGVPRVVCVCVLFFSGGEELEGCYCCLQGRGSGVHIKGARFDTMFAGGQREIEMRVVCSEPSKK